MSSHTPPVLPSPYRARRLLGEGSFGATWAAQDEASGREVAVKLLDLQRIEGWKAVEAFEREARALEALWHPAIPRYVEHRGLVGERFAMLVQELAPGLPLDRQREALDEPGLRGIARQVLAVLEYLGSRTPPVVHRDIKPANLVRGEDGTVRLVDFGAVKMIAGLGAAGAPTVAGTFGYMAPEQARGLATPVSDLFGLGTTLVHLATGRFPGDLPQQRLKPEFREGSGLSEGFCDFIDRLIEPVPDDRFASASEALAALRSLERARPKRSDGGRERKQARRALAWAEAAARAEALAPGEVGNAQRVEPFRSPATPKRRPWLAILGLLAGFGLPAACFGLFASVMWSNGDPAAQPASVDPQVACEAGDAEACWRQLRALEDGRPGASTDELLRLAGLACDGDVRDGCGWAASAFDQGRRLPRDPAAAIHWYGRACALNTTNSCDRLDRLLREVPSSDERDRLRATVEAGWAERCRALPPLAGADEATRQMARWPCVWLARWIAEGRGRRQASEEEARPWRQRACDAGCRFSCEKLEPKAPKGSGRNR